MVYKIILFVTGTAALVWVSRNSLRSLHHHGFYRFFAWETILVLFILNAGYWFLDPSSPRQITSWLFLIISLVLIFLGVQTFRKAGQIDPDRVDPALVGVEKTTRLVTTGIYRYIRHPFYSSLLFLGWGIFLKNVTWIGIILAALNTALLLIAARREENENKVYFGEKYSAYMQQTRMFIPYIF